MTRATMAALLTWLPLLILSAIDGDLIASTVGLPFLLNFTIHVRFLFALPLLIESERLVDIRIRRVVEHLSSADLVPVEERSRLEMALEEAMRSRDSVWAEIVMIVLIFTYVFLSFYTDVGQHFAEWRFGRELYDESRSVKDWWFVLISAPIFQFVLLRWVWRLWIWSRLLWRISRLRLRLAGTHPDKRGGLSFINKGQAIFGLILFALSSVVAAHIWTRIVFKSEFLFDFKELIVGFVVLSILLILAPLLVFTPHLVRAKRRSLMSYEKLALKYTHDFENKWFERSKIDEASLLGSTDIQSLSDLSNSFDVVDGMRIFLFARNVFLPLVAAATLPMFPLILTLFPMAEILKALFKIIS